MTITEPTTLVTDYVLGVLCLWLGWRLLRRASGSGRRSARFLAGALAATGVAALAGGTVHGFREALGAVAAAGLWKLTVLSIGVTSFLFLAAALQATVRRRWRRLALGAAAVQLLLYSGWMLTHDAFIWAIADYVPAMLVVLGLEGLAWRRGDPAAPWIAAGILVSLLGAAVQASGLSLHRHLNHNDLYHVIQMAGTVLLYRGGLLLRDR